MIIIILVFGLIFRLINLNQSLWLDEATSGVVVRNFSFLEIVTKFSPGDFHPPLYYFFIKIWTTFFGTSELGLRSLSVIFGVATIYLVYKISKSKMAAILLATSGLHIYYSQEARMYVMATFFVCLAVYAFQKKAWFWFTLALVVSVFTHYLAILIIPVFWLYQIVIEKKINRKFIFCNLVLGFLFLLWLPIFMQQLTVGGSVSSEWASVLGQLSLKEIFLIPVKFMIGRISFENKFIYAGIVGCGLLIFGSLIARSFQNLKKNSLYILWLILPVALALIVSIKLPILNYFRFLFLLPAFYILASSGLTALPKKFKNLFVIILIGFNLLTSGIYLLNPKFHREDWRSLIQEVNLKQNLQVVFPTKSQREVFNYYNAVDKIIEPENLNKNHKELWLIRYAQPISDPEDKTRKELEDLGYQKFKEQDFNGVVVWEYKLTSK